jgi:cell division protein FtsN
VIGSAQTVRALISALQSDARIRILSSPSVLATDNRPARIQVGSEEPIATGSITAQVGSVASSTTIQYRNTGRIVTIIPQVNSQGLVNLQILAEVSQRGASVVIGQDLFPSFDTRQAETTAVVQDGDTLAIGGIITENKTRDRSGIPYLMDVPFFGRFFGSTTETLRKTELIMLITPNVIRTRQQSHAVTEDFKSKLSIVRSELERIRREREQQELERQRNLAPSLPKDGMPPSPDATMPEPQPQSQPMQPLDPAHQLAPAAGASPEMPGGQSSTASQNSPQARLRGAIETNPIGARPRTPARSAPNPLKPEIKDSLEVAPGADSKVALLPSPVTINLAKANPGETVNKAPARVWAVQVASYARETDARSFAAKLKDMGYNVNIVSGDVAGQARYRVEIGPLVNRSDAQSIQKELAAVHKLDQALLITRPVDSVFGAQAR